MGKGFSWRGLWFQRSRSNGNDNGKSGEVLSPARLSKKEEMSVRLKDGFDDLSTLLRNINARLESQQNQNHSLSANVRDLPDLLRNIHHQIEKQHETFGALRDTLERVENAFDKQSGALRDLDSSYRNMVQSFQGAQERALGTFQRSQRDTLESFRRSQERQGQQFEDVLKQTQHSFTKLLLLFFVAIMGAITLGILFTRSPL